MKDSATLAIIRHVLTLGAGYLATLGIIDQGEAEIVAGSILALVAVGWSIWEKKKAQ